MLSREVDCIWHKRRRPIPSFLYVWQRYIAIISGVFRVLLTEQPSSLMSSVVVSEGHPAFVSQPASCANSRICRGELDSLLLLRFSEPRSDRCHAIHYAFATSSCLLQLGLSSMCIVSILTEIFSNLSSAFATIRVYALSGRVNIFVFLVFVFSSFEAWANVVSRSYFTALSKPRFMTSNSTVQFQSYDALAYWSAFLPSTRN